MAMAGRNTLNTAPKSSPVAHSDGVGAEIWRYIKLFVGVVLLALVLLFATQNADPVLVRFLADRFELSLSLLVFFVLLIGIVVGAITSSLHRWSRSRRRRDVH
jgi:uncharacterized integral membrane protein